MISCTQVTSTNNLGKCGGRIGWNSNIAGVGVKGSALALSGLHATQLREIGLLENLHAIYAISS